jgi:hypothetical protein
MTGTKEAAVKDIEKTTQVSAFHTDCPDLSGRPDNGNLVLGKRGYGIGRKCVQGSDLNPTGSRELTGGCPHIAKDPRKDCARSPEACHDSRLEKEFPPVNVRRHQFLVHWKIP